MNNYTPRQIVAELDKYVIGQAAAKHAVAIALRTRWRRQQLSEDLRDEVTPKNIIMIGPTGVGKTEISRRLAKLSQAPFIKVEASKFTEVGYVGRDVESMIRDLTQFAVNMLKRRADAYSQRKGHVSGRRAVTRSFYCRRLRQDLPHEPATETRYSRQEKNSALN